MRPLPSAVHIVTGVLLFNMLVAVMDLPVRVYFVLFAAAPFLMIWLTWSVLRDRSAPMRDLPEGDEWGYQDRRDITPVKD
jgi:hypothetical protein